MKKVNIIYKENPIIVSNKEVKKGIHVYECDDLVIQGVEIEKVSSLFEKYNNDDDIDLEISFTDFLENNEINWEYVSEGYCTEEEFIERYQGDVLVNRMIDEVLDAQGYYDWYEEVYFYEYWDGSNWKTLELENEGEDVVFITELEKGSTYEINLYYNIEEKEIFKVYDSYYQGSLLTVDNDAEIEDDAKAIIEDIENLLEKINYEIEHNNKHADKFEGFKITVSLNEEELRTFNYISELYDWWEKEDDNKLHITTQYK